MDQSNQYPSIGQAIWLLVFVLVLQFGLTICAGIFQAVMDHWHGNPSAPIGDHPAVMAVISLIAFGLILMWGLKKAKAPFMAVFPLVPILISLLLPMSLTIIGAGILLSEIDNMFRIVLPEPKWHSDYYYGLVSGKTSLWGSILLAVVIAPITEELLFRGLILRGLLSRYSVRKSLIVSAILFGAIHVNPWQFVGTTIMGLLFAWWFVQTRSLFPCIFGHALNNAMHLILLNMLDLEIRGFNTDPSMVEFQPLWFDVIGVLFLVLGVWFLIRLFGKIDSIPFSPAISSTVYPSEPTVPIDRPELLADGSPPKINSKPKHSGLGIASFVISVVGGIGYLVWLALIIYIAINLEGISKELRAVATIILGNFTFVLSIFLLANIGIGIASLFQKNKKRIFAILGLIFSSSFLFLAVLSFS